jgi:hypothetical protein
MLDSQLGTNPIFAYYILFFLIMALSQFDEVLNDFVVLEAPSSCI